MDENEAARRRTWAQGVEDENLITRCAVNRVVLRDDLSGDGYWAAVEMMDSDDALGGLRSVWLHWYMKPSIIDVLHVSGVR